MSETIKTKKGLIKFLKKGRCIVCGKIASYGSAYLLTENPDLSITINQASVCTEEKYKIYVAKFCSSEHIEYAEKLLFDKEYSYCPGCGNPIIGKLTRGNMWCDRCKEELKSR